jgi:two-component system, OmpR family, response regulator
MTEAYTSDPIHAGRILVVDDDPRIRTMLSRYLEDEGFAVALAENGETFRAELARAPADVVLLDINLPGEDGLTLARELRARDADIGIVMLTGRGDVIDRVVGLEVGADDYIPKPFHLREVLARIKTVLRRSRRPEAAPAAAGAEEAADCLRFEGWQLDLGRRQLTGPDGRDVALTSGEFDLLRVFVQNPHKVLDRDRLMDLTRGRDWSVYDRSIDTQVSRLRKKIEADPGSPTLIKSVRGVGYVFTGQVELAGR